MAPQLASLVPRLLHYAAQGKSVGVRIAALRGLRALLRMSYHRLHPLRGAVQRGLGRAVGDHKRVVRQAAVVVRNEWALIGDAPTA